MVNFVSTSLGHGAHTLGQALFWMLLWDYVWITLTFKLVNFEWSRLPSIMWMGCIQSAEGTNGTNDWLPLSKKEFSNRQPSDLSPEWLAWAFLGLQLDTFWTWIATSALLWISSLTAHSTDLGFASLHNHVSQFLKSLSLHIHTYIHINVCMYVVLLVVSLKNPD